MERFEKPRDAHRARKPLFGPGADHDSRRRLEEVLSGDRSQQSVVKACSSSSSSSFCLSTMSSIARRPDYSPYRDTRTSSYVSLCAVCHLQRQIAAAAYSLLTHHHHHHHRRQLVSVSQNCEVLEEEEVGSNFGNSSLRLTHFANLSTKMIATIQSSSSCPLESAGELIAPWPLGLWEQRKNCLHTPLETSTPTPFSKHQSY